jgi:hypothetical protein
MAVIADVPKTPSAENVFKSAWIPAQPPLSEPAIVSAVGYLGFLFIIPTAALPASGLRVCSQPPQKSAPLDRFFGGKYSEI